jgi:membrane protein YdbS with pleckstrin-like domain
MASLWLAAVLTTIMLPLVASLAGASPSIWRTIPVLLAGGWLVLLGLLLVRKLDVRYVLTSERLVHESGILTRYTHRIELIDIDDVSLQQGILDRLLSVGTIAIHSSDRTDPVLIMPGIDAAPWVAEVIDDARRAERIRRGLFVESI